ncbi:phosphopantetheine-binding protein, partial [Pilimelia columellifera]|uniref:phosphopantetheine-binding protein n=1 Tax=Pilimelia columellifera TaxID=706574 RepID=UPI0031D7B4B0
QQVLQAIQQNPQQLTAHLPTLHNTERRHILETWSRRAPAEVLPAGIPATGARVYLLDSALRPVPARATGELYLAGRLDQLNLRPDPERLVADPFAADGSPMYRLARLGQWTTEGQLRPGESVADRLTLGTVQIDREAVTKAATTAPRVERAVVVVRSSPSGTPRLVAYVQPEQGQTVDRVAVQQHLRATLPRHMVPSLLVQVTELPLAADGSVDEAALPTNAEPDRVPRDATEEAVAGLYAEVLGLSAVDPGEDFFYLGGNSLLATRLAARVRDRFSRPVTVREILENPSPAELARTLHTDRVEPTQPTPAPAPATRAGQSAPVVEDILPLSALQEGLRFHSVFDDASPDVYTGQSIFDLDGAVDYGLLHSA